MNILIVTDNRFWRAQLGSHRRILSLCDHLAGQGHTLRVLFRGAVYPVELDALAAVRARFAVDTQGERPAPSTTAASKSSLTAWLRRGRNALRQALLETRRHHHPDVPLGTRRFALQHLEPKLRDFADPGLLERFRSACRDFAPQAIIVEYVRLAYVLRDGADAVPPGCITLVDTHDVQHERQSRFHERGERHDIDITPAEEAAALATAQIGIAIQATDAAKLRALLPDLEVIVAGFPADIVSLPYRESLPVRIGFFGSSMLPNVQAARTLISTHFTTLRERHGSDVELHIYGGVSTPLASTPTGPGVFLHGFVDDLTSAYRELDIIANPVDFGGGLKIKNVEALCFGRPLVTTPIGAEGMEDGSGIAFVLADDGGDFTAALEALVVNPQRRVGLGQAAYAYAASHFSEAAAYRELDELLARQASSGKAAPPNHHA